MILRVNPNRMELLRLRKRLVLARRGHKLLQDKLEEMMRRFLLLLKEIDQANKNFQQRSQKVIGDLVYSRITSPPDEFNAALARIQQHVSIHVDFERVMNVRVPAIKIEKISVTKNYEFFSTTPQMDMVVDGAGDYIQSLLKLSQLLKTLDILAGEIERSRRRVNALRYMLIPSIEETIHYITQKLNEFERGNLVRLMRVKEIVRGH
jgi:V/A-type H+/Na+-transporting ATPase subunit D